ncbi:unnamed protein product [Prorocentrum cordatum]|uniref:SET domain-containing protein n=1 Tax=Prorocentrum cordatum TaxID=2364126 RepID=A0ABN9VLE8_9DINO|nr:unnamed protein product [Polarella glacialis]
MASHLRIAVCNSASALGALTGLYGLAKILEEQLHFERLDRAYLGSENHHDAAALKLWHAQHVQRLDTRGCDQSTARKDLEQVGMDQVRWENRAVCARLVKEELERRSGGGGGGRAAVAGTLEHQAGGASTVVSSCALLAGPQANVSASQVASAAPIDGPSLQQSPGSGAKPQPVAASDWPETASFTIHEQLSTIPDSDNGAFIRGSCRRGELLSLYQGPIHAPVTGRVLVWLQNLFAGQNSSEYMLCLTDSYMIDGDAARRSTARIIGGSSAGLVDKCVSGALFNHPPSHVVPNAMFVSVTVDTAQYSDLLKAELNDVNWYARQPWTFDGRRYVRTAALIALCDVCNEELFVDYGFPSDAEGEFTTRRPAWYADCGGDATRA